MAVRDVVIPGIVITGELGQSAKVLELRAECAKKTCLLRLPLDRPQGDPERDLDFRAFRCSMIALARARHAAIPAVLEMGTANGRPYALLELAAGETLAERLRWGPVPEPNILLLGQHVLSALREVHRCGLVHGRLTPAQIVLLDGYRDLRIVGFGSGSTDRETRDPRSDLAALGRVLYECASGRSAFAGLNEDGQGELTELPELSRGNEPLTSPELSSLVAQLLRAESPEAHIDVDALLMDFERLQVGAPLAPAAKPLPECLASGLPEDVSLVGRGRELETLRDAWNDVALGRSAIVHLRGTPGSGKSRLVRTLVGRMPSEPRLVLAARCVQGDARPFAALADLLDGRTRKATNGVAPFVDTAIRSAGQELAPLLKRLSPELKLLFGETAELGEAHEMQALFAEGAAEFLTRLLRSAGPSLVVVDDLQWMDAGSRTVLTRVADRARHSKTLFLVTSRDDEESAAEVEAFFRPIRALKRSDFFLRPLECHECRQLVGAYLGTPDIQKEIVEPLASLGDGTPLSILEVLHTIGVEGLLSPTWGRWSLDCAGLERMQFPSHTREILARRAAALSPNALRAMGAAAVLGATFDEGFLRRVVPDADCESALEEARHARVLTAGTTGQARFIHETVREALLERLAPTELRALHQRVAEALDADDASDTASVCRRAAAYAAGDWTRSGARVFATNYEAGLRTFECFDNDRALSFLTVAARAAAQTKIEPDAEFYQTLGEVYVRRGALSTAREYFQTALARAKEPLQRGILHSRIAWVDYTKGDTEVAWRELEMAFASLSQKMPTGKPLQLARAVASFRTIRRELKLAPPAKAFSEGERRRIEALCAFHYQAERLALETDKPARFLAHVLKGMDEAERAGPSRALVRSLLLYAFTEVSLGLQSAGLARLAQAEEMAGTIHDPVISAYCLQIRSVVMGWAGDLNAALDVGNRLILEQGHWIELSEYCSLCWNQSLMLGLRGQAQEAWQWVARGIEKIRHEEHLTEISAFLAHAARAALGTLGREMETGDYFEDARREPCQDPSTHGPHRRFALGSRVRAFTESGDLDGEFEAVVREVRSSGVDPSRAHLALCEFYVHVAHARVHQCLRTSESERRAQLGELSRSVRDLRAMARIPVLKAHLWVIEGYQSLFENSFLAATLAFSRADDLAQRENCPWVLYAVARGRAHLHKMQGRDEAALAQAALAATIAETHGYAYRLRWIREEFPSLVQTSPPQEENVIQAEAEAAAVSRRLVDIVHPANDSNLAGQARRIVDLFVQCVHAERGSLSLSPEEGGSPTLVAGRDAIGQDLEPPTDDSNDFVRGAFESGRIVVEDQAASEGERARCAIALPLVSRERVIGVVSLEANRPFSGEEQRILELLTNQTAVAIELTRALRARTEELRERKLLEDELRQAQKMEAIGRLSGAMAHDFNNLLTIIGATVESAEAEHGGVSPALADIREACKRGAALTSQLLTFTRRQASAPELVHLNALLSSWIPLIRRLLPENVEVVARLESDQDTILADPNRLEQVLLNLAANARDAMPNGGRVTIATRDAYPLGGEPGRGDKAQDYVVFTVEDTGEGMEPEVLRQAFDPFFTTKARGKGTGLGLSTVYGTVQQMHGRITLDSAPGQGTVFHMYFPRATQDLESGDAQEAVESCRPAEPERIRSLTARRPDTILLVDDERLILTALERGLAREGYRIVAALTGESAIELVKQGTPKIDMIVTDVLMPGMSGPELIEKLDALGIGPPHLFISGFTDGAVVPEHLLKGGGLLVKPFAIRELVDRIRQVLEATEHAAEGGGDPV